MVLARAYPFIPIHIAMVTLNSIPLYKRLLKEDRLVSVLGRKSHGLIPGVQNILEGEFNQKRKCDLL